jgi:hypothetical protein
MGFYFPGPFSLGHDLGQVFHDFHPDFLLFMDEVIEIGVFDNEKAGRNQGDPGSGIEVRRNKERPADDLSGGVDFIRFPPLGADRDRPLFQDVQALGFLPFHA